MNLKELLEEFECNLGLEMHSIIAKNEFDSLSDDGRLELRMFTITSNAVYGINGYHDPVYGEVKWKTWRERLREIYAISQRQ